MAEYLIGIDVGTTNVKAGLFTDGGELCALGSGTHKTYFRGNMMAEQRPEEWWDSAVSAIRQMLQRAGLSPADKILGISVSSQAPSLVPVDREGRVLRDALIWMDRRAEKELREIVNTIEYTRFREITGASPDSFYLLPKLYWYKKQERELFKKTEFVLQTNGYINYRLTHERSYDISHAMLSLCMDVRTGTFSEEIEKAVGMNFGSLFPPVNKNEELIGTVTRDAAEVTGIPEGTPVAAGTTDTIAALLSFGMSRPGEAAEITGTSTLAYFTHGEKLADPGRLMLKQSPVPSIPTILNAPINATGASVKWYLDMMGEKIKNQAEREKKEVLDLFTEHAAHASPGCGGLLYFPYLMGERGPLWNTYARGMFIGMTLDTTESDLARSILEGTSYALRHLCEEAKKLGARPESMRVSGGGAANALWLEIKASVLNIPVLVPDRKSGNAILGDALLAGKAVGLYDDLGKTSSEFVTIDKVIEPKKDWVEVYEKLYPYYRSMYQCLDPELKKLADTVEELQGR
ncbi:carbohydrate kinase [Lactonifactor longoviformis]|uniref:Xylulokinase n=1 Tax=Lactonifactor longoviformis DSM 17459 TaxID=1122155 RepID=A0A1M4UW24_9CLOT|nr:FGGY family carbohydrate kinase [Lactonifactor longoviformis]POP33789.1 carbohydrate kinase [Lactonifactor longoviformis]SHE60894.1 xylulokinase [Lactonifactor longoviformis DSM 17459]